MMNLQGGDAQDRFSRKRNLEELLHSAEDDSGYIEGKVFMIWPPRNKLHRVNLEVVQDSALYRFEVQVPHRDGIAFRPHERISLALKGVKVDPRKQSSAPHYFPIVLRFPDGVVLKYLSGTNAGKVVDTLEGNTDEWYNPSMGHTIADAVTTDASEIHRGHVPVKASLPVPISPRQDLASCRNAGIKVDQPLPPPIAVPGGTTTAQCMRPTHQSSTQSLGCSSKTRSRKRRRLRKEKESTFPDQVANNMDRRRPADVVTPCYEQPQIPIHNDPLIEVSDSRPESHRASGHTNEEASIRKDSGIGLSHENDHNNSVAIHEEASVPALRLKAGVRTQGGDIFTPLSDLRKGHSMINIIGVVTFANPEIRTRTNEWARSFTLVDPSTVDLPRQSITVNCFQKKYPEWLPQVQKGDIVILRRLKIVEHNGVVTATGYSDKLRWAVYDLLEHSIRPPNKGGAPEKEPVDGGMGYDFSPYWEPFQDSIELGYCRQIGEWWKAKQEFGGQNISMVQSSGARKRHLLISEASPDLPPKGFFNCTVEVLQKFDNHGGAATVYVTDYTANALIHPVQATWCPPELRGRVLQCDMWDDARSIARMMNPGEYWYLHNVRAKWNPSHYMEGTMQLAEKVTQLNETRLEVHPHLRALLARKSELGLDKVGLTSGSSSSYTFPEMLLQDVEGSTSFLTCIVELLHNCLNSREGHLIYITDYTYNPDLPTTVSTADWAHNLEHRVLKVKLDDAQAKISLDHESGSALIIHNLRIKRLDASGGMLGYLGGGDTLIHSLCDPSSQQARTLQRNKEKWKRENTLDCPPTLLNVSDGEACGVLTSDLSHNITLQEVITRPVPGVFRVLARTVDFFPFSLEDACVLRCTKCESSPPPSFQRCPRCDDMVETHCKWLYRLYILLHDGKGSELIVSLSGKECTLLQAVDPVDFRCDQVAFRRFLAKLDPILGNLRDVHAAWSRNEHKVIESPPMIFTIESWNVGVERGYSLLDCTPTEGSKS